MHLATRPAGGAWSEPITLTDPEGEARDPDLVIDEEGAVTVIWQERVSSEVSIIRAVTRSAEGEWEEPVTLSDEDGSASSPDLAVDPEGGLTAVWVQHTEGRSDGIVQSKSRPADGAWSADAADLFVADPYALATVPQVEVDAEGNATAVWERLKNPKANEIFSFIQSAHRVDGEWGAADDLEG